jgi:hypothetical protein
MSNQKRIALVFVLGFVALACERMDRPTPPTGPSAGEADAGAAQVVDGGELVVPDAGLLGEVDAGGRHPAEEPAITLDCLCSDRQLYAFCASVTCLQRQDSDRACNKMCVGLGALSGVALHCGTRCA